MKKVSIIGVGPGALDLLTLRAQERIKDAEIIFFTDSLISPEIIETLPKGSEKITTSSLTLEEILSLINCKFKEGKNIVRLHDGDPCLFSAINEQINGLKKLGIEVDVIPGISAYQATAAKLKRELTIPDLTQTIILSRAAGRTGTPEKEQLNNLASIKSSLCIYLSARHVKEVQQTLLNHYPPETPVVIAYRVSWKDEWIKTIQLKEMASTTKDKGLIRTTLFIISPALKILDNRSNLYKEEHKHLFRPN